MDFFQSQETAKRNTAWLVALFVIAVISIVIMVNLLMWFFFGVLEMPEKQINWEMFFYISLAVCALIGSGSLYKTSQLAGGGDKVAQQMNGQIVLADSEDFKQRQLLNIVEEMSLASGIPVPSVYIVPGKGINAFAAGHSYSDAVVGVSEGALAQLTRSEMQGVIAHEFSHILNGDMRINIRIIGVLHGILLISIIGSYLIRTDDNSKNSKGTVTLVLLGIGLMMVGYVGVFFGNLIKAAVNRQREYLADSAAVQFTRNPDGIAGALIRIGANAKGSRLEQLEAEEVSHALFSQGFRTIFATHPPLEKRIRRVLPAWDGKFTPAPHPKEKSPSKDEKEQEFRPGFGRKEAAILAAGAAVMQNDKLVAKVGRPDKTTLAHAQKFISTLPSALAEELHSSYGAQAVIYALVFNRDQEDRRRQFAYLETRLASDDFNEVKKTAGQIASLKTSQRLPLIDLALPSLRQLSADQYQKFRANLKALIFSDKKMSFFEWVLYKVVIHHLDLAFGLLPNKQQDVPMKRIGEAASVLLSAFLTYVKEDIISREEIVSKLLAENRWLDTDILQDNKKVSLKELDAALDDLASLKMSFKKNLLQSCAAVITAGKQILPREKELFRAVSSSLNCPVPMVDLY
ncbi:MAG: hypothetical protein CSB24_04520 [Deltaproteobacteria bacterium]|nr:MAG: hypothetical protein CSB24_04520 [Deltaproteobacteria bacterium]